MKRSHLAVAAAAVTLIAGLIVVPAARSQIQASPAYVPIGVSSSGATSTVWFHDPSSRQAVACHTVLTGTNLSSIQCVTAKLP
jgi:hypothetical protein